MEIKERKIYLDMTEGNMCLLFSEETEVVHAGAVVHIEPESEDTNTYQRYADEHDIHFIFEENVPQIDFYTVPMVEIFAVDSEGGYIGTIGDLFEPVPVCYIDKEKNCYIASENAQAFLENPMGWKERLTPHSDIEIFKDLEEAKEKYDFFDRKQFEREIMKMEERTMFREMRRIKQLLPDEVAVEILERNTGGTLALSGDDDYPYAVPISYVYVDGALYFHSAKTGHKIDAIKKCNKASFCVIDKDEIVPEKYTTFFRSVIAFGKIELVEDVEEMKKIATTLAMKYSSDYPEGIPAEIDSSIQNMAIIKLTIEHMTAKEAVELVKMRNK